MDHASYNVIYVDRRARDSRVLRRGSSIPPALSDSTSGPWSDESLRHREDVQPDIAENIQTLLSTFREVFLCTSGSSCRSRASHLNDIIDGNLIPTLIFIDIPPDDSLAGNHFERSPNSADQDASESGDETFYGGQLLQYIVSEIQYQNFSKLIVPIALVASSSGHGTPPSKSSSNQNRRLDTGLATRLLDAGAVDVLTSPFSPERAISCAIHAYRAQKEVAREQQSFLAVKRGRKRSWVGIDEEKPYAYLREAMVSGLMDGICSPHSQNLGETFKHTRLHVMVDRRDAVAQAIGSWSFSAHAFSDDELLHAALLMLQHALSMPELEQWRIPTENLTAFLIATRTAYNSFVPYHNFRHVVDVLQAVFFFLLQVGTLPSYPLGSRSKSNSPMSPMAALLRPFDALTLLISAVGHDVGHPGVNNAFLVTLNAPLAQLYNDQSVLESFHCAAFSQILRRYWPASFQTTSMRKLMISLILATDMGLHFDYMKRMGFCQEKLHENGGTDGWDGRLVEEQRTLVCSLLIKCADISNVARHFDVAAKWATILTDEFARQASMEKDLEIPSALFAPPIRDSIVELGKSQIGFMNLFALPLFQGVNDLLPGMKFSVDQMHTNKATWERKMEGENARLRPRNMDVTGSVSPRSGSPTGSKQPETFPAGAVAPINEIARGPSSNEKGFAPSHPRPLERNHQTAPPNRTRRTSKNSSLAPDEGSDTGMQNSAVLVTSPQKPPKTADSQGVSKNSRRKSSEKSSLPSSQDRQSQTTSPTNVAYSPTTQGTSFFSVDSSEKLDLDGGAIQVSRPQLPSSPPDSQYSDEHSLTPRPDGTPTPTQTIRQRPSRWKLNFGKARKKAHSSESS